jgi:hypothetical protein
MTIRVRHNASVLDGRVEQSCSAAGPATATQIAASGLDGVASWGMADAREQPLAEHDFVRQPL